MKKNILFFTLLLLVGLTGSSYADGQEPVTVVDVELAKFASAKYLPKYYPGKWKFFDLFICYDFEGIPATYVIVFHKAGSSIVTQENVTTTLKEIRKKRDMLQSEIIVIEESEEFTEKEKKEKLAKLKMDINRQKRASNLSDTFATVITGATETSPSIIRCFLGLPSFLVNQNDIEMELKVNHPERRLQLGNLLYLNPLDIRYEVKEEAANVEAMANKRGAKISSKKVSDSSFVVRLREGVIELTKVSDERAIIKKRKAEKEAATEKTSDELRALEKEKEANRNDHFRNKWGEFSREQQSQKEATDGPSK